MSASRLRLGAFLLVLACCLLLSALVQTLAMVGWADVGWFTGRCLTAAAESISVRLMLVGTAGALLFSVAAGLYGREG